MKWLYKILRLFFRPKCFHKWTIIHKHEVLVYGDESRELPIKRKYAREMQCQCCGEFKTKLFEI